MQQGASWLAGAWGDSLMMTRGAGAWWQRPSRRWVRLDCVLGTAHRVPAQSQVLGPAVCSAEQCHSVSSPWSPCPAGLALEISTSLYPQHFLALASSGNFAKALAKGMGKPVFRVVQTHFAVSGNVGAVAAKEEVWEVAAQLTGYAASVALLQALEGAGGGGTRRHSLQRNACTCWMQYGRCLLDCAR